LASLYQAFIDVVPETRGLSGKLNKAFGDAGPGAGKAAGEGMNSGMLGAVGKLAAPLAAAFAALGIGRIVADSVSNASDFAEAGTAITAVFGDADSTIQKFAAGSAAALGQSTNMTLDAARTFGTFGKAAGLSGEDLAGFSTDFITLAGDLASFNNTTPEQAIEALGAGLRGESEPLRQYGVLLDDAALKARATELGIYSGTGALTAQQKVLASQAEIMAQTGVQQGDFAKTSGGLANQQRILSAGLENLSTTFGAIFLPAVLGVVGFLNRSVIPAFEKVVAGIAGVKSILVDGDFTGAFRDAFNIEEDSPIVDYLFNIREAFLSGGFLEAAMTAFEPVVEWLSTGGLVSMVEGLLSGRSALFGAALELFPVILDAIVQTIPQIISSFLGFIPQVVDALVAAIPLLLDAMSTILTSVIEAVGLLIPLVAEALVTAVPQLVTALLAMLPVLLEGAITLFQSLITAIATVLPLILTALVGMLPGIVTSLVTMLPALLTAAVDLFMQLVTAIIQVLPVLITSLLAALPQILGTLLGMLPSLLTTAIDLFFSLITAVVTILPELITAIIAMLPVLIKTLVGMSPQLMDAAVQLFSALLDGLSENLPMIVDLIVTEVIPGLIGAIIDSIPLLLDAGGALMQGFIDGIAGAIGGVGEAIGGVMEFVGGFFPHSPAKRGPFSGSGWRAVRSAGVAIGDEFGAGLTDSQPGFESSFGAMVSASSMTARVDGSVFGSQSRAGLGATSGRGGDTYNIHEAVSPIATAMEVARRQNARAAV